MARRVTGSAAALLVVVGAAAAFLPMPAQAIEQADRVIVHKAERRLDLMRSGQVLRSFRIALGLNPDGHKLREGDFRTPEGSYRLNARNEDSDFFLSIQISYPSKGDAQRARRDGERPGNYIMIHGQPNNPRYSAEYYRRMDWTNGCIAVSNADMIDIWLMTRQDLPIQILP